MSKMNQFGDPTDNELHEMAHEYRPQKASRGAHAKRVGRNNEHRSIRLLEASGYRCTRAAGSLGAWDIIGIGPTDIILLQTKTRDWPSALETECLKEFPCPPNCKKILHRWRKGERLPDVREL